MHPHSRARVLLVAQPVVAGVPHHVTALLAHLDGTGWQVDVMCPRNSVLWSVADGRPGVRLHPMPDARTPRLGDVAAFVRLLGLLRQVDVAHAHSSKAGLLVRAAAAATCRSGQAVFTPHGWSFWACRGLAQRGARLLERVAARWCAAIITVSSFERDAGLAAGIGRADLYRVVPNGVDSVRFAADPAPVAGRIVMVGRLAPPKRQDVAIRALALVRRTIPDAHLELVGGGPLRPGLEHLAEAEGVAAAVVFAGERDDVPERLRAASCVLLASGYEGCSLAVLEAMAAARPVVASRVGGMDELVDDGVTGLLVSDRPEDVARALVDVLAHPVRAEAMGAAARRRVAERFSADRMAAATLAAYRAVRPQRTPPGG